ncbi:MAG: TM2 domain-containing protein, partial [Flavobacteriales bacterium]|nr:TM2 domain-containing protein [Flavobacteriales bacterium]
MDSQTLIAALLCLFLGTLGIHWFYLGNKAKGLKRLGLWAAGVALSIAGGVALNSMLLLLGYAVILANFVLVIVDLIQILTNKV